MPVCHSVFYNRQKQVDQTDNGTITAAALEGLLEYQNCECAICHNLFDRIPVADHKISLYEGGVHQIQNIQLVHWKCNFIKGPRLPSYISKKRTILISPFAASPDEFRQPKALPPGPDISSAW